MAKTLANPTIQVNGVTISIIPNSFSYKSGKGNTNLRSQSAGGNSIQVIKTVDAETKKSMAKFSMITTNTNISRLEGWQDDDDGVTIDATEDDFNVPFQKMYIMEDPEIGTGAEGSTEVTFEGDPLV
jgi:hypothetical protein